MKIFNIRYLGGLIIGLSLIWVSCEEDREIIYDDSAAVDLVVPDPYLQVVTGFLPFEPGTEKYGSTWNVINGTDAVTTVRLYGNFNRPSTSEASNEVMYGEYAVDGDFRTIQTDSLTYAELIAGLTIGGAALPATDDALLDGDGWSFRFEGVYADGRTEAMPGAINMVFSKYAGIYEVSNSKYMRIVPNVGLFGGDGVPNYDGNQVFIGYVDGTTLSYNDWWGYFAWGGCSFNIVFDPDTKVVTDVPVLGPCGLFSGSERGTCADTPGAFDALSAFVGFDVCAASNVIIDNDVTGEHQIKLTYAYLGGGGYRQFTETLTKVVD